MMQIGITFKLPVEIFKEEDWYVANCPALDVASQGGTPEEAKAHLGEALIGFLETCIAHGTLEEVFRDCGFTPVFPENTPEMDTMDLDGDTIDVPLFLLAKFAGPEQCYHA